ncbi:protein-methionine-sulfoxide reductase heme-binding subunit MsrQ [Deinococcus aerolatus]|uniref:Protein-methionine-sulfoxide reductase heme-binding subunit MsrQ n=1 Tax=Deinococcus aerolatus TaxID=522487 RepID=A0ABQ2G8W2_9DEIO|nr:protein-methionine-sulfoxide reductase heme-binding subunit MsrQ [Deinococcus aerolatus]GGL80862.1 protein-methionine-sulfoxide reductase heme-binding subunit MsrQ [Deinococcus aerolatus]
MSTGDARQSAATAKTPDRRSSRPRRKAAPLGWLVPAVTVGGLLPVAVLIWDASTGALGANPIQRATLQTGLLTLTLLVASLACTPLRLLTGWTWPARIRKALGLLAFGYGVLHFLIYLFDHGFSLGVMFEDVLNRPFVTVGFTALLLLVPLALTSGRNAVKRLGFQKWTRLHRLVYLSAGLGALHYFWGVKQDIVPPLLYAGVIAVLFALRLVRRGPTRQKASPA